MARTFSALIAALLALLAAYPASAGEPAYGFRFSGFFKTDAIYDDAIIHPGNFRLWVNPYDEVKDNAFYLTANETRLGLDFWWREETFTTSAKLELDLYGVSAGENRSQMMLRHAYVQMKGERWLVLAGQTWDIISPLNPRMVNYSVLWTQGNIGYRRPQIRAAAWTPAGGEATLRIDAGISRNIAGDFDGDGMDDGADSGVPAVQGRLGFDTNLGEDRSVALGAWGHFGRSSWGPRDSESADSWSLGADLTLTADRLTFMGEFFTGASLGQYMGGVAQSITPLGEALPASGGWAMLSLRPAEKVALGVGYGFDNPAATEWKLSPGDTLSHTLRDRNSEVFVNCVYDITGNVQALFEIAWCKTEYLTRRHGAGDIGSEYDAMRFQFALKAGIK